MLAIDNQLRWIGFDEVIFTRDLGEGGRAYPSFPGVNAMHDHFSRSGLADIYQELRGVSTGDISSAEKAQRGLRTIWRQAIGAGELVYVSRKGDRNAVAGAKYELNINDGSARDGSLRQSLGLVPRLQRQGMEA